MQMLMKEKWKTEKRGGYTIIETMIAVSLFIVIVIAGIGALLNANLVHNKSEDIRSIMDNLTFIMEDMSRHIRTGYNYRCYSVLQSWNPAEDPQNPILNDPRSCTNSPGKVIVFEEAYGTPENSDGPNVTDQWIYLFGEVNGETNIYKSTKGGEDESFIRLNDSSVSIDPNSFFFVRGAEPPDSSLTAGNLEQPLVTIHLKGHIEYKGVETPFALQTTVTQRLIDVTP